MVEREKIDKLLVDQLTSVDNLLQDIKQILSGEINVGNIFTALPFLEGWEWKVIDNDGAKLDANKSTNLKYAEGKPGWAWFASLSTDDPKAEISISIDGRKVADTTPKIQNEAGLVERGINYPYVSVYDTEQDIYMVSFTMSPPWAYKDNILLTLTAPSSPITFSYDFVSIEIVNKRNFFKSLREFGSV